MENLDQFIQKNSPDGGFLQSEGWRAFQESVGHESVVVDGEGFYAMGLVHELPIVGNYLYVPRGPVIDQQKTINNQRLGIEERLQALVEEATKKNCRWLRIEPANDKVLTMIESSVRESKLVKAPHDVQPREIFQIDLSYSEEELLVRMKQKTRYNIHLAEKKGVQVIASGEEKYRDAFVRLVREMAFRKGLTPHPEAYYRKMLDTFLQNGNGGVLYVAVHEGDVLAASLVVYFGDTATYLHGGLGETKRECMAPYLLQWEAIRDAKRAGKRRYDFGGVNKEEYDATETNGKWYGITKFKFGFSPETPVIVYPGSYDLIFDPLKYRMYERLHFLRENYVYLRKFMGL